MGTSSIAVAFRDFKHISMKRSTTYMVLLLVVPISLPGILDEYDSLVASSYALIATYVGIWKGGG